MGPLLTLDVIRALRAAAQAGKSTLECSLDLGRSTTSVDLNHSGWRWRGEDFPFPEGCRARTVYYWDDADFRAVARFTSSLVKLVPTEFGPPTFEIDGIKMLPTSKVSPYADAQRKVDLIEPRGKAILDTCAGLGYFAAWCMRREARQVLSFEISADVLWLCTLNPWSPPQGNGLTVKQADIAQAIESLPDRSFDAVLHDPPRFGIAGELYSQTFYEHLARVLNPRGRLFHYTGMPNKLTTGRDVPAEVAKRLRYAGFATTFNGDGVLGVKR